MWEERPDLTVRLVDIAINNAWSNSEASRQFGIGELTWRKMIRGHKTGTKCTVNTRTSRILERYLREYDGRK